MTGAKRATDEKTQIRTKRSRNGATNPPDQNGYPRSVQSPGGHKQVDEVIHRHAPAPELAKITGETREGYLGPTSYGAVFRESQLLDGEGEGAPASPPATSDDPLGRSNGPCNLDSPKHFAEGVDILQLLPDHNLACRLLDRYYEVSDVFCHEQTARRCHESMWSAYHDALHENRSKERLEDMSKRLCKNAMSPLPPTKDSKDWFDSYSGSNLRWELIANFFICYANGVMTYPEWDQLFADPATMSRVRFGDRMRACAEACLSLVNDVESPNDFVVAAMLNIYLVQSWTDGDTSPQLWRRFTSLGGIITQLGLHREPDPRHTPGATPAPSFLVAEIRRRLFCEFFNLQQQLCTITGRPPLLSRRFVTTHMPLDLTDEELDAGDQELLLHREKLNARGWNPTFDGLSRNRITRAWYLMSLIRDEILELAQGPLEGNLHERRERLKAKLAEDWTQIPPVLRYDPRADIAQVGARSYSFRLSLYQEYLINKFLLNRLPDQGSQEIKQDLIDSATQMLHNVLSLSAARDKLPDFYFCTVFTIIYSGIPAAATLSVELLKQSKYPHEWRPKLPRADVIQSLSQFLGCLDWVGPTEGNYNICVRMRKIIKRVLDEILELPNPPPAPQSPYPSSSEHERREMPDPVGGDVELSACLSGDGREEADFLDWLNSVDWTRDVLQDAWM